MRAFIKLDDGTLREIGGPDLGPTPPETITIPVPEPFDFIVDTYETVHLHPDTTLEEEAAWRAAHPGVPVIGPQRFGQLTLSIIERHPDRVIYA